MSILNIITEPDPLLHQKCKKVKVFDDKLKKIARDMIETLRHFKGVGLAAPQIGIPIKLIAVEFDPKKILGETEISKTVTKSIPLTILVNPKITWSSKEKSLSEEGCLSLPDIELSVERSNKVHIKAQDINGKYIKLRAENYFAYVLQHEIDHLNGILITDKANIKPEKIVFMGTGNFAEISLKRLIKSPYKPYLVITEPDKPAGRGQKININNVKILAKQENIKVWQPKKISEISNELSQLAPDIIIVVSYGQIIPKSIIKIPKFGILNVHPSLLPKYRGASPIQSAILAGDKLTGVTIIKMDEKVDHGPILEQIEFPINKNDNFLSLSYNLAHLGANLLVRIISRYISGQIKTKKQNHKKAIYCKTIKKEDGKIDWNNPPEEIERKIRAYYPWPGAYTTVNGKRLKICQAHLKNNKLIIDKVQLEGKREINFDAFLRGYRQNVDFLQKIS